MIQLCQLVIKLTAEDAIMVSIENGNGDYMIILQIVHVNTGQR